MGKTVLTHAIIQEWDVARRTVEFLDDKLSSLRTFSITTVLTIIGVALQLRLSLLMLVGGLLPIAFLFIDRRFQSYLKTAADYAAMIEEKYGFAGRGLTHKINEAREGQTVTIETMFTTIYIFVFFFGVFLFLITTGLLAFSV